MFSISYGASCPFLLHTNLWAVLLSPPVVQLTIFEDQQVNSETCQYVLLFLYVQLIT